MKNSIWQRSLKLCAALGAGTLLSLSAQAQNNFTDAGETVDNTFSLTYSVNSVSQPAITPSATQFTVDRLIDVLVDYEVEADDSQVPPGSSPDELVFQVRNDSNDNIAFELTAFNETETDGNGGGTAPDPFNTTGGFDFWYYVDDGDGTFEPGGDDGAAIDLSGSTTPDVAPDATIWVEVRSTIPGSVVDTDFADVTLLADAVYPTAWIVETMADTPGNEIEADTPDNSNASITGLAENYLADGTGAGGVTREQEGGSGTGDGQGNHSDTGRFTIASPNLSADKTVIVIDSGGSGVDCTNFALTENSAGYYAPGACIEYVITVVNSGSATASITSLSDTMPSEVDLVSVQFNNFATGTGTVDGGSTASDLTPTTPTDCDGTTNCVVAISPATVTAGQTATIRIRGTVE